MKCATAVMMSTTCLLLSGNICTAQQTTLSIPITIPQPQPVTVVVQQPVTIGAFTYLATGTLTLTPVATKADLPPVTGPQPDWPLMIGGYFDASGHQKWAFNVGDTLRITGNTFGDVPGTVRLGLVTLPVTSWSDQDITLPLTAGLVLPAVSYQTVEVAAATGGKFDLDMGIIVNPAPVAPGAPVGKTVAALAGGR